MILRIPVAAPGRMDAEELRAVRSAIDRAVRSGSFVGGPLVESFEEQFAAAVLDGSDCVSVGNGQDALTLALAALDLRPGGGVLVPANDGGFAASSAQAVGLVPVQMDCAEDGLVRLDQVQRAWGPEVCAVVVTHLHGLVVDTAPIQDWCHRRGVRVVEDCAQAHGAAGIAVDSDASAFSFYPTKNLGALGDGGAVVTADADVARRVRRLRHYGWGARYRVESAGGRNSRMDAVQAAVLSARLPFLASNNERRRSIVSMYARCVAGRTFLLRGDASFVAHHAVLVDADRGSLVSRLDRAGIGHDIHYPYLVSEMPAIRLSGVAEAPTASTLRQQKLSLPCFPNMAPDEVDAVCDALVAWTESGVG